MCSLRMLGVVVLIGACGQAPAPPLTVRGSTREPPGYTEILWYSGNCVPASVSGCSETDVRGNWYRDHDEALSSAEVPDAPSLIRLSGAKAMRTVFRVGQPGGSAPAGLPGWGPGFPTANRQYHEIYASFYIKIGDRDYQAYNGTNKFGFFGVGSGSGNDYSNDLFFDLRPVGAGSENPVVVTRLGLGFEQQNHVARDLLNWPDHFISTGRWYHWEINLQLNTLGSANGVFRWWVDGVLVADLHDVQYITPGNTHPFYSYYWNPTFGGGGPPPVKTRSDNVYTAQFYVSGKP